MTDKEKNIIRCFANGNNELRQQAIDIHRKHLDDLSSPEQLFMREVDTPCPDLLLRNLYRKQLVDLLGYSLLERSNDT